MISTDNSDMIIKGSGFTGGLRKEVNGQQIESNFQMIYYGEFLTKEKEEGALVKQLYSQKNKDLIALLSKYEKPSDYEELKTGIYTLIEQMPDYRNLRKVVFPPKTIDDALLYLE